MDREEKERWGTSLAAQWLRLRLSMNRAQVQSLVREILHAARCGQKKPKKTKRDREEGEEKMGWEGTGQERGDRTPDWFRISSWNTAQIRKPSSQL